MRLVSLQKKQNAWFKYVHVSIKICYVIGWTQAKRRVQEVHGEGDIATFWNKIQTNGIIVWMKCD